MERKLGWLPDYADIRDYTEENDEIKKLIPDAVKSPASPSSADLRQWFSPVEDQGNLGSCTAHAGVGIVEYCEKRAFGKHIDASRLFLYKVTRNFMRMKGDSGAFLRSVQAALILFGVPPEEYWPYVIADFDKEPTAFCYAFAQNYQTIKYYRHDPPSLKKGEVLNRIKSHLSSGIPAMFGFTVYSSIEQAERTGRIPYPTLIDRIEGGHAIVAVGYDDKMQIKNKGIGGIETTGALLIRNSWGRGWGESGYGWLPYEYILKGLAEDFWSILKQEWVDTGIFAG